MLLDLSYFLYVFRSKLWLKVILFYDLHSKLNRLAFILEAILCFQNINDPVGSFVDSDKRLERDPVPLPLQPKDSILWDGGCRWMD